MIQFTVFGLAQPGGSKRAMPIYRNGPNGREVVTRPNGGPAIAVVDANPKIKSWRQEVAAAASKAMVGKTPFLDGPLVLVACFVMPRPRSHYRTGKHAGELRPDAPKWHTVKPDSLKLTRAIEDSLTGIVWRDDCQVAKSLVEKMYGDESRVMIGVSRLDEDAAFGAPAKMQSTPLFA